jgi:hypothetical protein
MKDGLAELMGNYMKSSPPPELCVCAGCQAPQDVFINSVFSHANPKAYNDELHNIIT